MARTMWAKSRTATAQEPSAIDREEIARLAYELFERRGCIHGDDQQDWFEAERMLQARRRSGNGRGR